MFRLTPPTVELTEADVIQKCKKLLDRRGYWLKRNPVGKFQTPSGNWVDIGPAGIPDFTAVHRDYPAFFIEFKRPGKVLRPNQQTKFSEIQFGYSLHAVMVDSVEQLEEWLGGHERRHALHVD